MKNDPQKKEGVESFGTYLKSLRNARGFTLADVALDVGDKLNSKVARTTISAIEGNRVNSIKPLMLEALAAVLGTSYDDLVRRWTSHTYNVKNSNKIIKLFNDDGVVLNVPNEWNSETIYEDSRESTRRHVDDLSIISLTTFRDIQGELPAGSRVYVAATDFLDDDMFYQMVLGNFKKRVEYFYHIENYALYERFVNHVTTHDWDEESDGPLHGEITHFLKQPETEESLKRSHRVIKFPLNCVLLENVEGHRQAFVGLIIEDRPAYYQVADIGLTYRIQSAFMSLDTYSK